MVDVKSATYTACYLKKGDEYAPVYNGVSGDRRGLFVALSRTTKKTVATMFLWAYARQRQMLEMTKTSTKPKPPRVKDDRMDDDKTGGREGSGVVNKGK